MAESAGASRVNPRTPQELVEALKKAFEPTLDKESRETNLEAYHEIIRRAETWSLLPILNSLVKPNVLPPLLRETVLQSLVLLPMRSDGVRGTLEFILSVHPSNQAAATDSQQPRKSGADITAEAVALVTKVLSTVPAAVSAEEWYGKLGPQLFQLIDGEAGSDVARTAAQIIGFGILSKRAMGAPGTPGWNIFVQPLLEKINPTLKLARSDSLDIEDDKKEEGVVDLSCDKVVVSSKQLEQALRRLELLILSNPSSGLCKRVLKPVLLQLWALASISNPQEGITRKYYSPAQMLLQTYLKLSGSTKDICSIIQDILCEGSIHGASKFWQYRVVDELNIDAIVPIRSQPEASPNVAELGTRADRLVQIVTKACSNEEISDLFLSLISRWVQQMAKPANEIKISSSDEAKISPFQDLTEVVVLEKLMELPPEKLVGRFDQLVDVLCQILKGHSNTPLGDDVISVILSILNLVVTAPNFQRSDIQSDSLKLIEDSLDRISHSETYEVSRTAKNLAMLLKYRDEVEPTTEGKPAAPSFRQVEDKRTCDLAMSYITGDSDNPPPVVSEGLNMLSTLIVTESPVLDITSITVLMSNLLKDNEDYINLRVIKIFTQLANKHPKSTIRELLDSYLDAQEKSTTDVRLRFGEALGQVIERLGETFSGDVAKETSETLLAIAGRRGYRPKTRAKQAREEKLAAAKKAHGSSSKEEDHDMDLGDDEEVTEEEKRNNDTIAQILQGWESKRGSEDVRMRASALSILRVALETNIVGVGPTIVSNAVDLCINVLVVEKDIEYGILRRAAILVVFGFVRALHQARESGRSLGFGLTDSSREDIHRTLEYVGDTDNDGLVQQHARDVVESLENWQASSLLPQPAESSTGGLARLAGLNVNPLAAEGKQSRPRIEEVE